MYLVVDYKKILFNKIKFCGENGIWVVFEG